MQEKSVPKCFKVLLDAGNGDCLRVISTAYPFQNFHNHNPDVKFYASYSGRNPCRPPHIIKEWLVDRSDFFQWIERKDYDNFDAFELDFWNPSTLAVLEEYKTNPPIPFVIKLSEEEQGKVDNYTKIPFVAIQLSSNDSLKMFGHDRFKGVINSLLNTWSGNILIYDWPHAKFSFDHPRVISMIGESLAVVYHVVSKCKLLVSADSWSKYVIATHPNTRAVLLYSSLTYMPDKNIFQNCSQYLFNNQRVTILGIKKGQESGILNLDEVELVKGVSNISIDEVVKECNHFLHGYGT